MSIMPPSYKFNGDINKSISYKATGLQLYNFIANNFKLNGVGFVSKSYVLPDKTRVDIVVKSENNYNLITGNINISSEIKPDSVVISTDYMESGFLFLRNIAPLNEGTYLPAIIKFSEFVKNKSTTLIDASKDRKIIDGDISLAVGCPEAKKVSRLDITDIFGASATFINNAKVYCSDLITKKTIQEAVPPSVFSGKLRLLIQSIYGSKRSDYSIDLGSTLSWPYLYIRDTKINSGPLTSGLFKDDNGVYWLIQMGSTLYARKMIPNKETLIRNKDKIKADPLNEAYILSTLIPSKTVHLIGQQSLTDGYEPIAYGWKFNTKGDSVSIVVTKEVYGINDNVSMHCKLVTVSIGTDKDTKLPKIIDSQIVATGYHIPYHQTKTFVPVYGLGIMRCLIPQNTVSTINFNLIAPIYCYYSNDVLQIVTARNGQITTSVGDWEYSGNLDFHLVGTLVEDSQSPIFGINAASIINTGEAGITINGDNTFSKSIKSYPSGVTTLSRSLILSDAPSESIGSVEADGTRSRYTYYVENGITPSYYQTTYSSASKTYETILIIPFSDCESVSVADSYNTSNNVSGQVVNAYGNNTAWRIDYWNWTGGIITFTTFSNTKLRLFTFESQIWSPTFTGAIGTDPSIDHYGLTAGDNSIQKAKIYTRFGDFNLQVLPGSIDGLRSVTRSDPFFYNILQTYSSYSGSYSSLALASPFNKDWPILSIGGPVVPVGWA